MLYQRLKFAVRCFLRRKQADRELEEEIRAHLAMAEQERLDRGETSREAKQNASRELGNELLIKETTRDMWGWSYLERLAHDMRYVSRQIRRSPENLCSSSAAVGLDRADRFSSPARRAVSVDPECRAASRIDHEPGTTLITW